MLEKIEGYIVFELKSRLERGFLEGFISFYMLEQSSHQIFHIYTDKSQIKLYLLHNVTWKNFFTTIILIRLSSKTLQNVT